MNRTYFGLAGALSLFMLTATLAGQTKPAAAAAKSAVVMAKATPESIAGGEKIFKRQCQMCHGATGVGDGPAAKTLKGKLPDLTSKTTLANVGDDEIRTLIQDGKKSEIGNMPSFKAKLKPEEIQDTINYVRTLGK